MKILKSIWHALFGGECHHWRVTADDGEPYRCTQCGKKF